MLEVLKRYVRDMEDRIAISLPHGTEKTAVFDLDGTLIHGDIGDAVFAYLTKQRYPLRLSWQDYRRLLFTHRSKAYRSVVQAMEGLETETIVEASRALVNSTESYLEIQSDRVAVPKPRPLLMEFLTFLHEQAYRVYVISASNHLSVQLLTYHWFGIPPSRSFGIAAHSRNGRLTAELIEPVPIGSGKSQLYWQIGHSTPPLITATDNRIDLPLLHLTHPLGFSIWVGEDRIDYDTVMNLAQPGQRFFLFDTSVEFPVDEF